MEETLQHSCGKKFCEFNHIFLKVTLDREWQWSNIQLIASWMVDKHIIVHISSSISVQSCYVIGCQ